MVTWTDVVGAVAAVLAVIFTGALVAAAFYAGLYAKRAYEAALQQVEIARDQHADTYRPVLVPTQSLLSAGSGTTDKAGGFIQETKPGYDRNLAFARVAIKNAGPGIALNIWGVVFEPEPELEFHKQTGQRHSHRYEMPLEPGKDIRLDWAVGGVPISGDTEIGATTRYKLFAPHKPTDAEVQRGEIEKVARLTLTYSDIFGRKHAAIYDFTVQNQWENVAYLRNITQDLGDMERESLSLIPVFRAPAVPIASSQ